MNYVGREVLIKPLDLIKAERRAVFFDGLPDYAVPEMEGLYGNGAVYKIVNYDPYAEMYTVLCGGREWDFPLDDLIIIEESEITTPPDDELKFKDGEVWVASKDPNDYMDYYNRSGHMYNELFGKILTIVDATYRRNHLALVKGNGGEEYVIPTELLKRKKPYRYREPVQQIYNCNKCGEWFINTDPEHTNEEDLFLCEKCRKRKFVTPYHRYSPHLDFWKTENDDDLYLGAEIEIDDGGESNMVAGKVVDMMNPDGKWFMYCSHDGSLNCGFEMITSPATLNYHLSIRDKYDELFAMLRGRGYRSHNTSTCGLHVHFSRSFFGADEEECIMKLLYLSERFWDEFVAFSRRDYNSLARYARKIDASVEDFVDAWDKRGMHEGHYYAINISNENTIEMRMFRGTLNVNTYLATLHFVDSMARAAKKYTSEELQSMEFDDFLSGISAEYYNTRRPTKFDEKS